MLPGPSGTLGCGLARNDRPPRNDGLSSPRPRDGLHRQHGGGIPVAMGNRPEVETASAPVIAFDVTLLASN